ncbi:MAG: diguanylate cyclase [Gallionellaceae bacterium]
MLHNKYIRLFRTHRLALLGGLLVFTLLALSGEMFLHNRADDHRKEHFRDGVSFAAKLRSQVESELNSLLYLSSGLGSYLVVRNDSLKETEVNDILSVLHKSNGHIRNFGIAVGYTIKYVYPHVGNKGAIGLHYPDHPEQWTLVKKIIDSGSPALAGPINLVQGGHGLIYRVPLYIDKKYWGLLSTVIDLESFAEVISAGVDRTQYEFAIRGKDGAGTGGGMVLGSQSLFETDNVHTQEINVPGGKWVIAVRSPHNPNDNRGATYFRLLIYSLALLGAWMMYMLIRSRSDLANLAMYDQLTGLPNRHLLEDRAAMAFSRQKRKPEQITALLFLDLDGFKAINDNYGHKAGDAILVAVADRISSFVRENDTVARWGGDEFIVLMENVDSAALKDLVARLRVRIESPVTFEGATLSVGVSVGLAINPKADSSLDQIIKSADQQMYNEKQQRKIGN